MFLHHLTYLSELLAGAYEWSSSVQTESQQHIIQLSAISAGFVSITVPIALNIVSNLSQEYKDKEIAELFLKSKRYRLQVFLNLAIILSSIILLAYEAKEGIWFILVIVLDIVAIGAFILFISLVGKFSVSFDDYYSNELKRRSNKIVQRDERD
jgi:hypothetical protein